MDDETKWKMGQHRGGKENRRGGRNEDRNSHDWQRGRRSHLTVSEARTAWSSLVTERRTRNKAIEAMGQSVGSEQGK